MNHYMVWEREKNWLEMKLIEINLIIPPQTGGKLLCMGPGSTTKPPQLT
jgi:hypothetical protein